MPKINHPISSFLYYVPASNDKKEYRNSRNDSKNTSENSFLRRARSFSILKGSLVLRGHVKKVGISSILIWNLHFFEEKCENKIGNWYLRDR